MFLNQLTKFYLHFTETNELILKLSVKSPIHVIIQQHVEPEWIWVTDKATVDVYSTARLQWLWLSPVIWW